SGDMHHGRATLETVLASIRGVVNRQIGIPAQKMGDSQDFALCRSLEGQDVTILALELGRLLLGSGVLAGNQAARQKRNVSSQDEESGAHHNLPIGSSGLTAGDY